MKLLQTNLSQCYNQTLQNKPIRYERFETPQDTFIRTSSTVSFKSAEQNIYKKILNNPTLAEKFMGLIAAGAATLIAAAGIEKADGEQNTNEGGNIFANLFAGLLGQNNSNSTEIDKYIEENEKLKKENKELKTKLEKGNSNQQEETENNQPTFDGNRFTFPKKRGRLSSNQQELKSVTEQLNLTSDEQEKLLQICQELLTKNSHTIDGKKTENDDIAKNLATALSESKNDLEAITEAINTYFYLCILSSEPENTTSITADNNTEKVSENSNTAKYGAPKLRGTKVVGKIDLPKKKEIPTELIIKDKDGNIKSIFFKKTGTPSEYSAVQLNEMFRYFVKTIYNDYKDKEKLNQKLEKPKWLYNTPVPKRIRKQDVEKEIKKMQVNKDERYENIKKEHIQEIVELINEDPRYNDLFDIHSALRLLDRYVNFNSYDKGIDIQSKQILDKLFDMIEQAYKDGVYIDVYKDKESGFIGPTITLKAEDFDSEAIDLFGTTDIIIGMLERQNGKVYKGVENNRKEAVISTVYPKDM